MNFGYGTIWKTLGGVACGCFSAATLASLAPMTEDEMSEISGKALGINLQDVSVVSDRGSPADMTYATLEPAESDSYVRLSHFYAVGAGGDPTSTADGNGVSVGSVDSPIMLRFPDQDGVFLADGSLGSRSAMVLCWTGSDCTDITAVDETATAATNTADMGFRFDILGDPNKTPRNDADNVFTDIVWVELNNFAFESERVPSTRGNVLEGSDPGYEYGAYRHFFGYPCEAGAAECTEGPDRAVPGFEEASTLGGSWLTVWPDELTGLSMAANIRLSADELRWSYETDSSGGYDAGDFAPEHSVQMSGVEIDLQLGHPFYQPVRLYTSASYDSDNNRTRAEQVLEIPMVPYDPNEGCGAGTACGKFYEASTNVSDIYIDNLQFGEANLGSSYVQGIQIQYLRIQTHDIVN